MQKLFKCVVVPTLGLLALGEYAVLLGPPPRLRLLMAMTGELKVRLLRGSLQRGGARWNVGKHMYCTQRRLACSCLNPQPSAPNAH